MQRRVPGPLVSQLVRMQRHRGVSAGADGFAKGGRLRQHPVDEEARERRLPPLDARPGAGGRGGGGGHADPHPAEGDEREEPQVVGGGSAGLGGGGAFEVRGGAFEAGEGRPSRRGWRRSSREAGGRSRSTAAAPKVPGLDAVPGAKLGDRPSPAPGSHSYQRPCCPHRVATDLGAFHAAQHAAEGRALAQVASRAGVLVAVIGESSGCRCAGPDHPGRCRDGMILELAEAAGRRATWSARLAFLVAEEQRACA